MSQLGWIIIFICIGWIAACYYFLFRKGGDNINNKASRSESDVITFYKTEEDPSSEGSSDLKFPQSVTLYTETIPTANSSDQPKEATHSQFNDEDLIDIRTLSLNITNQN